jgi:hypothetical protein
VALAEHQTSVTHTSSWVKERTGYGKPYSLKIRRVYISYYMDEGGFGEVKGYVSLLLIDTHLFPYDYWDMDGGQRTHSRPITVEMVTT